MRIEPAAAELLRVAREIDGAGGDARAELARLMTLMPEWKPVASGEAALREGTLRLAGAIRAGRFDAGGRARASPST